MPAAIAPLSLLPRSSSSPNPNRPGPSAWPPRLPSFAATCPRPKISAAFERGALSYSKDRAMTRIADADNEDYLLMIAEHGAAYHVEKLVAQCRKAERMQEAELADARYRQRELTHYYNRDGCLVIKARIPADRGALVVKALERAMDQEVGEAVADVTAETSTGSSCE